MDCPGDWYPLTSRGNERGRIYRDDSDPARFLELLDGLAAEGVSRKEF